MVSTQLPHDLDQAAASILEPEVPPGASLAGRLAVTERVRVLRRFQGRRL